MVGAARYRGEGTGNGVPLRSALRGVTMCTKPVHCLTHGFCEGRLWQAKLTHRFLCRKVHGASRHSHASQRHQGRLPSEMRESFTDGPKRHGQTVGHAPTRGGEATNFSG